MGGLFKFRFSVSDPSDSTVAVIKRFLTVTRWFSSCILENFWSLHIFIDNFHPPYSNSLLCFVFICKFKRKSKFFGSICPSESNPGLNIHKLSLCQSERDNCTSLQPQFGKIGISSQGFFFFTFDFVLNQFSLVLHFIKLLTSFFFLLNFFLSKALSW